MSNDRFEVVVHHGGTLIKEVPFNYIGGEICYWDIDPDTWSYFGVVGPAKSGEGSGVEVGVEAPVEVQQEVEEGPLHCGGDLERDDGVQVDTEELGGVEEEVEVHSEEEVELHSEEEVELHSEEEVKVHSEEEVELHNEKEVELHTEEEVEVDSEEEVEVDNEEEVEVDTEDKAHIIALDNSDSEYKMEDNDSF
ncbi:hypothetical protein LR48_Vigan07g052900 [Vigna angularis]|uniref:PB1-like domain-containing protein n=1 Tax=Phaseolus angularis TaxID=3914 RepID=A0A0L9UVD4_PHAAN|nr:hypothetical protein LR48_Vigan07g052900 [Vigna angularis]